jgi:hypothetical protein
MENPETAAHRQLIMLIPLKLRWDFLRTVTRRQATQFFAHEFRDCSGFRRSDSRQFLHAENDAAKSVFVLDQRDPNLNVIIAHITIFNRRNYQDALVLP